MTTGLTPGERIVVVPVKTSPGWHYKEPHGVISRLGAGAVYADVQLDDGRDERVHIDSLQREKTHRRRTPPRRKYAAYRPHPPLADGPWAEEPLT